MNVAPTCFGRFCVLPRIRIANERPRKRRCAVFSPQGGQETLGAARRVS